MGSFYTSLLVKKKKIKEFSPNIKLPEINYYITAKYKKKRIINLKKSYKT